ncbi:MAG: cyclic lactone autoinducer peptide [Bacillota bacterium]|nr:cyclic lactone autoinducer peptide [Bacillota bacterium]
MNESLSVSKKFFLLLSVAALRTAIASNGTLCTRWIYQPQAPKSLLKLAK